MATTRLPAAQAPELPRQAQDDALAGPVLEEDGPLQRLFEKRPPPVHSRSPEAARVEKQHRGRNVAQRDLPHGAIDLLWAGIDLERVPFGELVLGQKGVERLHASILQR